MSAFWVRWHRKLPRTATAHRSAARRRDRRATSAQLPENDAFLASLAGDPYESLYEVCLHLGLRQGEAFGLTWGDVDLERGTISIRQSLAPIRAADRAKAVTNGVIELKDGQTAADLGRLVPLEPKTKHSRATLPLTATGVRLLRAHYRRELEKMVKAGATWQGGDPLQRDDRIE